MEIELKIGEKRFKVPTGREEMNEDPAIGSSSRTMPLVVYEGLPAASSSCRQR